MRAHGYEASTNFHGFGYLSLDALILSQSALGHLLYYSFAGVGRVAATSTASTCHLVSLVGFLIYTRVVLVIGSRCA